MRGARLGLAAALAAALGASPAQAGFDCVVSGPAGTHQVRKIDNPTQRLMRLSLQLAYPFVGVTDRSNWHIFGGVWVIDARTGDSYSFGFLDVDSTFGPPAVQVTFGGQNYLSRSVPSTDFIRDGVQGAYGVNALLDPGTYYLVGFGTGYGTWTGTFSLGGEPVPCPEASVAGKTIDYDPSDFSGGTHVLAPGVGHGRDIRLSFTNAHPHLLGGLFAYEPPPLPPASVTLTTESGSQTFRQQIVQLKGRATSWSFTANYTGIPTTILIRALMLDLSVP